MRRWQRILLEILGPPGLGGAITLAAIAVSAVWAHWQQTGEFRFPVAEAGPWIITVLAGAYIFTIVPSLLYTALMEWRFSRGLRPGSGAAITWSSAAGGLNGWLIIVVIFHGEGDEWIKPAFVVLGICVGVIMGLIIRWRTRADASPAPH